MVSSFVFFNRVIVVVTIVVLIVILGVVTALQTLNAPAPDQSYLRGGGRFMIDGHQLRIIFNGSPPAWGKLIREKKSHHVAVRHPARATVCPGGESYSGSIAVALITRPRKKKKAGNRSSPPKPPCAPLGATRVASCRPARRPSEDCPG
jgi:hypothetical protein